MIEKKRIVGAIRRRPTRCKAADVTLIGKEHIGRGLVTLWFAAMWRQSRLHRCRRGRQQEKSESVSDTRYPASTRRKWNPFFRSESSHRVNKSKETAHESTDRNGIRAKWKNPEDGVLPWEDGTFVTPMAKDFCGKRWVSCSLTEEKKSMGPGRR